MERQKSVNKFCPREANVTKLLQWSARFGIVAACTNQGPTVHTYLASRFLLRNISALEGS